MFSPSGLFNFDPFGTQDRFRADPFQQVHHMMNEMFNDPFFASPGFGHSQHGRLSASPAQVPPRSRFSIEELDGPQEGADQSVHPSVQPYVEEPGDQGYQQGARLAPRSRAGSDYDRAQHPSQSNSSHASSASSFYLSSSSFSREGGHRGYSYRSSSSSRMGPGGIMEQQETVQDGRTGESAVRVSRYLDGKGRTITRRRSADGQETGNDELHNLRDVDTAEFHDQWTARARHNLPPQFHLPQGNFLEYASSSSRRQPSTSHGRRIPINS